MEKKFTVDVTIRAERRTVTLPVRTVAQADIDHAHALMEHIPDKVVLHGLDPRVEASSILKMAEYPLKEEEVVIQGVRIGEQVIVTFPGEVFLEYGYEGKTSVGSSRFAPNAGDLLAEGCCKLVQELS